MVVRWGRDVSRGGGVSIHGRGVLPAVEGPLGGVVWRRIATESSGVASQRGFLCVWKTL